MTYDDPQISLLTEDALFLHFSHDCSPELQSRLLALAQALRAQPDTAKVLRDVVPGPGNLMLRVHPDQRMSLTDLTERLESLWQTCAAPDQFSRTLEIPVRYGGQHGPDLEAVARHCGLSADQIITLHCQSRYQVMCIGFQPGFPYLSGLDSRLFTPRRNTPRTRIPAGSVAIAGDQAGIYPADSPGGWQIIGHTELRLFDPRADPPCKLAPGDSIRFVPEGPYD